MFGLFGGSKWQIIWQREALDLDCESSLKRFDESGSVSKRPYPDNCHTKKLSKFVEQVILNLDLCNPGIFLREIKELSRVYHVEVYKSTLCIFLKRSGFTRQKMQMVAARQDHLLREMFALHVCLYHSSMLVFVDETGADRRGCLTH